ncbi:MAG: GNAT family N-acetyltransferase [Candidatus Heimdallarchaeota archaeon]
MFYVRNTRAIKTYLKAGFKEIGLRREARFREGKYHDVLLMDILRKEWKKTNI